MGETADVVVIGGGVVGTAVTYFLSMENVNVLLLERASLGAGTSSASSGAVALQTKTLGAKLSLAQQSLKLYHEINEIFDIDFEFDNDGSLMVASTEQELGALRKKVEKLQHAGVDVEMIPPKEAREYVPELTEDVVGASYCSEDCSVNPLLLVGAYQRAAVAQGARILTYTQVTDIVTRNGAIEGVATDRGHIATEVVVNATGPSAPILAKMVGVALPIVPRKGEIVVTEATRPLLRGELFSAGYLTSKATPPASLADWMAGDIQDTTLQVGVALNQTRRGNLLMGSTREFAGYDTRSTYRGMRALIQQTSTVLPIIRDLHVIRAYAGLRPSTPDGLPIVERTPDVPGFIVAAGHEGDGIALSPITGKLVAELVVGDAHRESLAALSSARFRVAE